MATVTAPNTYVLITLSYATASCHLLTHIITDYRKFLKTDAHYTAMVE